MKPEARLQATLELLELFDQSLHSQGAPLDRIVTEYFRRRRYAGSKDRRDIKERVFQIVRRLSVLKWGIAAVHAAASPRVWLMAYFACSGEDLDLLQSGQNEEENSKGIVPLSSEENATLTKLKALKWQECPKYIQAGIPEWALSGYKRRFEADFVEAATALQQNATLDIRLNPLRSKTWPDDLPDGRRDIATCPLGGRYDARIRLDNFKSYNRGLFEIQDVSAQIASYLVGAKPGMQVVDLCAGAAGKALMMAGAMENRGQIYALDISSSRMDAGRQRVKRAGAHNVQFQLLQESGQQRQEQLSNYSGTADRVILDVPCSGSGTWRRSPDLRYRVTPELLAQYQRAQLTLLNEGSALVKPGGRMVYMTCSLLPEENEDIIDAYLADNPDWKRVDYRTLWQASGLLTPVAETVALHDFDLALAPHKHGSDGFFISILQQVTA